MYVAHNAFYLACILRGCDMSTGFLYEYMREMREAKMHQKWRRRREWGKKGREGKGGKEGREKTPVCIFKFSLE